MSIFGQEITEVSKVMSLGSKNAFVIDHPRASEKMAIKAWENYMKEYGKAKKNRKAGEYESLQSKIHLISGENLDVYFKVEKGNEQVSTFIFFDDGSEFLSSESDAEKIDGVYSFLTPYVYEVEKLVIQQDLEDEEDSLKDLGKEQSKLEKENKKMHEDIDEWKKKIAETEADIETNLQEQENKKMEILSQEEQVEKVRDKLNAVGRG